MKKAIVFDLYGTLIDISTDETSMEFWVAVEKYFNQQGIFVKDIRQTYETLVDGYLKKEQAEHPDINLLDVFKDIFSIGEVQPTEKQLLDVSMTFRELSRHHIRLYPGAIELLDDLKTFGYQIILLSNAQACFTLNELKLMGIDSYFDQVFLSSDYKMCKPDSAFFLKMLQMTKLTADECIYIGNDHIADVGGAQTVGMDCIYLHTNCSQEVITEFDCLLKVIPGDLFQVISYFKKNDHGLD